MTSDAHQAKFLDEVAQLLEKHGYNIGDRVFMAMDFNRPKPVFKPETARRFLVTHKGPVGVLDAENKKPVGAVIYWDTNRWETVLAVAEIEGLVRS